MKAPSRDEALAVLEREDAELRALLGTIVFGVDDETMEHAVGALLESRGLTLGVAESMTGGLVASRLVNVPGSSTWFRGGVVAYDSQVKYDVLGVPEGPVVSEEAASAMAEGVAKVVGADVGLNLTSPLLLNVTVMFGRPLPALSSTVAVAVVVDVPSAWIVLGSSDSAVVPGGWVWVNC